MEKLLIILCVILAVVAVAQIAKLYQISADMRKFREEDIPVSENNVSALMMLIFMIALFLFFIYLLIFEADAYLPVAATEHGKVVDTLFAVNWAILFTVFFVMNFLLFFFTWKYRYNPNRKALYYPHNNRLELIWTVIPSIALAFLIIYGLTTWNQIMSDPEEDALQVEIYARQFDWHARYPGKDNTMGSANFTMISATNPLGIITNSGISEQIQALNEEIANMENRLENEILPDSEVKKIEETLGRRKRQKARVLELRTGNYDFSSSHDDITVRGEMYVPVNRQIALQIRSQDVIHSVWIPHFRVQMNAVPGMTTHFNFVPTITSDSMRTILNDPDFDYVLMCNKVCGAAHFNMQMNIIVVTEEEYEQWISEQNTFASVEEEREMDGDDIRPALILDPKEKPLMAANQQKE